MNKNNNRTIWSIAAFDSANLAGTNQDSRVIEQLGFHCKQVVTAQTAQSTKRATLIQAVSSEMLHEQLSILWQEQIPSAIKIGVLANNEQLQILIDFFSQASVQKHNIPIIFDPVLKSSSGLQFNDWDVQLLSKLMALCTLVTPNEQEYRHLSSSSKSFNPFNGSNLLVKSFKQDGKYVVDAFFPVSGYPQVVANAGGYFLQHNKQNKQARATGCTLSSAIACFVVEHALENAICLASAFLQKAIQHATLLPNTGLHQLTLSSQLDSLELFPDTYYQLRHKPPISFPSASALGLYAVVDSFQWIQRLVDCDVDTLQIRIKDKCAAELKEELASCISLCRQHNIPLYINDYWQLAIELGAYGVHLGQEDIQQADLAAIAKAGLRLGISTHGEVEFCTAKAIKPSYIAIGAIFPTNTKEVKVVGLNNLKRWAQLLTPDYPVCAIGGIGQKNLTTVVDQGVDSVAVVSAICAAEDYRQAASELKRSLSLQVNQQLKAISSP